MISFFYQLFGLILTAPIHCRGSTGVQVMQCLISLNLLRKKHPYILDGLKVSTFSANSIFWMNYSFKVMFPGSVTRAIREKREVRAVHLFILDCHT